MNTLGFENILLKEQGAEHTANEIAAQPELWLRMLLFISINPFA